MTPFCDTARKLWHCPGYLRLFALEFGLCGVYDSDCEVTFDLCDSNSLSQVGQYL